MYYVNSILSKIRDKKGDWYLVDKPISGKCEKCGETTNVWSTIKFKVNGDGDISVGTKILCGACISKVPVIQRLIGRKYLEDWDFEKGVIILCLQCGWSHFISAKITSFGGALAVDEWVEREMLQHNCDFYMP
jgi:predicted nucleic-acid-binding Zn-ribbon protein